MNRSNVSAVLFAKDLTSVAAFYSQALGMRIGFRDEHHAVLNCHGFELVVHQIPRHIAADIVIERPPQRRTHGAVRLDYPVDNVDQCRQAARRLGGEVDDAPPAWAEPGASFFFGYDPEGNQFGVVGR